MTDTPEYTPPEVWVWEKDDSPKWRYGNINRPIAGATHEKELARGKHPLQLYSLGTPNGVKVTIMLEELLAAGHSGAEYDAWLIRIGEGDQFGSGFVGVNPNSKIPALVDYSEPTPQRVFESGAILLYLGEKTGKFLPKPLIERIPVYEWLMWQMGGFGPMPGQVHHFIALENEQDRTYGLKRYMAETRRLYGVLDRRLSGRDFVADALSVADFAILGWAWRHPRHKVELKDFPNVERWYNTLMARPATKRGMDAKLD
jgi:GST-like protein